MTRFYIIIAIFLIGLAACSSGPRYRTNTSYIAPATVQGNSCVASCETTEQVCRSRADDFVRAEYPACMQRAREAYNHCMNGHYTGSCAVLRQSDELACSNNSSPDYRSCTNSFNACYQNCGGQIIQKSVCVRNCDG